MLYRFFLLLCYLSAAIFSGYSISQNQLSQMKQSSLFQKQSLKYDQEKTPQNRIEEDLYNSLVSEITSMTSRIQNMSAEQLIQAQDIRSQLMYKFLSLFLNWDLLRFSTDIRFAQGNKKSFLASYNDFNAQLRSLKSTIVWDFNGLNITLLQENLLITLKHIGSRLDRNINIKEQNLTDFKNTLVEVLVSIADPHFKQCESLLVDQNQFFNDRRYFFTSDNIAFLRSEFQDRASNVVNALKVDTQAEKEQKEKEKLNRQEKQTLAAVTEQDKKDQLEVLRYIIDENESKRKTTSLEDHEWTQLCGAYVQIICNPAFIKLITPKNLSTIKNDFKQCLLDAAKKNITVTVITPNTINDIKQIFTQASDFLNYVKQNPQARITGSGYFKSSVKEVLEAVPELQQFITPANKNLFGELKTGSLLTQGAVGTSANQIQKPLTLVDELKERQRKQALQQKRALLGQTELFLSDVLQKQQSSGIKDNQEILNFIIQKILLVNNTTQGSDRLTQLQKAYPAKDVDQIIQDENKELKDDIIQGLNTILSIGIPALAKNLTNKPLECTNMYHVLFVLFFNPNFMAFSTDADLDSIREKIFDLNEALKLQSSTAWSLHLSSQNDVNTLLQDYLVNALFALTKKGRYSDFDFKKLEPFKQRISAILKVILQEKYLTRWKDLLVTHNTLFASKGFSPDQITIFKAEFEPFSTFKEIIDQMQGTIQKQEIKTVDTIKTETQPSPQKVDTSSALPQESTAISQPSKEQVIYLSSLIDAFSTNRKLSDQDRYIYCIRMLLDPACFALDEAYKTKLAAYTKNFIQLHYTFQGVVPALTANDMRALQTITAQALQTLQKDDIFKNNAQAVLKSLVAGANPSINSVWVRILLINNPYLPNYTANDFAQTTGIRITTIAWNNATKRPLPQAPNGSKDFLPAQIAQATESA